MPEWRDHLIVFASANGYHLANREYFGQDPQMELFHFVRD
jgi:hypothetical protein